MRYGNGSLTALVVCLAGTQAMALETVNVTVSGVADDALQSDLEDQLRNASLSASALEEDLTNSQDILGSALSDYQRMVSVLYNEGFYGPSVSITIDGQEAEAVDPFRPPETIDTITIAVQTGPRFDFGVAQVTPRAPSATDEPIVEGFDTGEIARAGRVGAAANAGVQEWRMDGYPKADVADQQIVADHPDRRLDVSIDLAPGRRATFGELTIEGQSSVSERRLRQILGFPTGEVYSQEELREALSRLQRTEVFSTVSINPAETINPDGTLDYRMALIEGPPRRIGFSAEYSTQDGVTLGSFWLHRNLFGGAERLRIEAEASNLGSQTAGGSSSGGPDYFVGARLTRPATFRADTDAFTFAEFEVTDDEDVDETSFTTGIGLTRYFSDALLGEVSVGYRFSRVDDAFGERDFHHLVFPSRVQYDGRDSPGNPTEGLFANLRVNPFIGLDGSQSGVRIENDLRTYIGFGESDGTVLAGRLQLGSVVGSDLEETPPDFLFFSGGGGTVRGHRYRSLGSGEVNDTTVGGRSFLGASFEVRQSVRNNLGVVAFADVGYIGEDSIIDDEAGQHSGGGIGVRYSTPIGPIRADLATPLSEEDRFGRYELYIGVGQAF